MSFPSEQNHTCHWPGCSAIVPPKMWGCLKHWRKLPVLLRHKIWKAYVPGQEIRKDPSPEYLAVADEVQEWIAKNYPGPSWIDRNLAESKKND